MVTLKIDQVVVFFKPYRKANSFPNQILQVSCLGNTVEGGTRVV